MKIALPPALARVYTKRLYEDYMICKLTGTGNELKSLTKYLIAYDRALTGRKSKWQNH